jgi:hypothetical protein
MKMKDLVKKPTKDKIISVRITQEDFKWMKKNKVSPTLLFDKALEEIKRG